MPQLSGGDSHIAVLQNFDVRNTKVAVRDSKVAVRNTKIVVLQKVAARNSNFVPLN